MQDGAAWPAPCPSSRRGLHLLVWLRRPRSRAPLAREAALVYFRRLVSPAKISDEDQRIWGVGENVETLWSIFLDFYLFLYLREGVSDRERAQTEAEGAAGSLLSGGPGRVLGSWPEPKAVAQLTEPPRRPQRASPNGSLAQL